MSVCRNYHSQNTHVLPLPCCAHHQTFFAASCRMDMAVATYITPWPCLFCRWKLLTHSRTSMHTTSSTILACLALPHTPSCRPLSHQHRCQPLYMPLLQAPLYVCAVAACLLHPLSYPACNSPAAPAYISTRSAQLPAASPPTHLNQHQFQPRDQLAVLLNRLTGCNWLWKRRGRLTPLTTQLTDPQKSPSHGTVYTTSCAHIQTALACCPTLDRKR